MLTSAEAQKLQTYFQQKFGNVSFVVRPRKEDPDSAELLLGSEFIGIIYRDEEDGELSYDFNMAILAMDLPAAAAVS